MAETRAVETTGITVSSSACKNYFGFLSQRPKGTPIPEECLTCERMLDCMVSKPDVAVAKPETKPELNVAEQVGTKVTVEEVTGTETSKELKAEPEKKIEPSFKQQTPNTIRSNFRKFLKFLQQTNAYKFGLDPDLRTIQSWLLEELRGGNKQDDSSD